MLTVEQSNELEQLIVQLQILTGKIEDLGVAAEQVIALDTITLELDNMLGL